MKSSPILIMAPLRGVTDGAFRAAFERHFGGFDRSVSPFIAPMTRKGPKKAEIDRAGRAARGFPPSIPQALTADAQDFSNLIRRLADAGCSEVNWNLGCPHPPVIKRGRGAGLLPHPDRIDAILDRVLPSSSLRLSVKMRLGLENPDECLAVLAVLERYPLTEVIIHARVATQVYSGKVKLGKFEDCLAATTHCVVYNGDIVDLESFQRFQERFAPRVSGWMIGRGAFNDPWLPQTLKGNQVPRDMAVLRAFHDDLYRDAQRRLSGTSHILGRMKGLWLYLALASCADKKQLKHLKKSRTLEGYEEVVAQIL